MLVARRIPGRILRARPIRASIGLVACMSFFQLLNPITPAIAGEPVSAVVPSPAPAEAQLERTLYVLINQDRAERGLPPLVVDERLGEVAREQSRLMASRGCLSHNLEPSGGLLTRLGRAGYRFRAARENLALAGSVEQARDALLKSPPHLTNLLATDITHLGVGVVRGAFPGDGELYVTQIFTQPSTAPATRRADSGLPPLSASR